MPRIFQQGEAMRRAGIASHAPQAGDAEWRGDDSCLFAAGRGQTVLRAQQGKAEAQRFLLQAGGFGQLV